MEKKNHEAPLQQRILFLLLEEKTHKAPLQQRIVGFFFFTTPYTGEKTYETPLQQRILSFTNLVIILINY